MCLNLVTLYVYVYRTPNDGMAINAIHSHLPRFNDLIKLSLDGYMQKASQPSHSAP